MHKAQLVLPVCCSIPVAVGLEQFLSLELHWNFLHHQTRQSEHDLQCVPTADIHNYHAWSSKYPGYFTLPNVVNVEYWSKVLLHICMKNFENDSKISKPGMVEQ
jgi:hypothetical protein